MKRSLAILLCAVILAGSLTACKLFAPAPSAEPTPSPSPSGQVTSRDFGAVLAKHSPDEVVMTIDGSPVTWGEYLYNLSSVVTTYETYFGPVTDWDAVSIADAEGNTTSDYLKDYIVTLLSDYHIMDKLSQELSVTLSDEDLLELATSKQNAITTYGNGDEAVFNDYLATLYLPVEVYDYIMQSQYLYYNCFAALYGETGENCSDEDVMAFAENGNYIRVKHVLVSTKDEAGADLDEAAKAEKRALAEEVVARLNAAEDKNAEIDACIAEFSEDPGHAYYPDGYTMTTGEMDPAFEEAAYALSDGEVSGLVETAYGYHILLRLPLDADAIMNFNGTESFTLRYIAAVNLFSGNIESRKASAEVVYQGDFADLHLGKLLGA